MGVPLIATALLAATTSADQPDALEIHISIAEVMRVDPAALASVAGSALVGAMATDLWEQARSAMVELWRKVRPERAEVVEEDLTALREEILAYRQRGDFAAELELATDWRRQLERLMKQHADVAEDLQNVVDNVLSPALPQEERGRIYRQVNIAHAGGKVFGVQGGSLIYHEGSKHKRNDG